MPPRSARAANALAHLTEADPALASLAIWCSMEDGEDTTHTVNDTIRIGASFEGLPLREQIGTLGHHILHVALRHGARLSNMRTRMANAFAESTYNLASDALVNEVLEQAGHALPRPAVTLSTVLSEVLEAPSETPLSEWDVDRLYMALVDQADTAGTRQSDYEERFAFQQDLQTAETGEEDKEASDWQGHLTRATHTSGAASRGIGHVIGRIADVPQATVPWEIHLRRLLAKATSDSPRLSYRRPRNAWVAADAYALASNGPAPVFEPGRSRDNMRHRIVIGLDSSGSVSDRVLRMFAAEVSGIARRTQAETHLMYFDQQVYRQEVLRTGQWDISNSGFQREGGTSFIDVIKQAAKLTPSALVLLTDMDGPYGAQPAFPVIWATPDVLPPTPPFGTVLSLAR